MAVWARQQNGQFASGLRFVWEFLRDEVAAWRGSINALVDAQMPAGQAFDNSLLAHSANASEARWSLYGAPRRTADLGVDVDPILLPVGGFRCPHDLEVRYVEIALASTETDGWPFQPMSIAERALAAGGATPDPLSLPEVFFTIRYLDRDRASMFNRFAPQTGPGAFAVSRRAGKLFQTASAAVVVSSPISIANRAGRNVIGVGPEWSRPPDLVLGCDLSERPRVIEMSQTLFRAGDVLVGVIDMPGLPGVGGTSERYVESLMGYCSVRIEYARRHAS